MKTVWQNHSHPFPPHDLNRSQAEQGIYQKFDVRRIDGRGGLGGKHDGCEYFVLDMTHDAHALAAITAYAAACESTHPSLATDLRLRYPRPTPDAAPSVREWKPIDELEMSDDLFWFAKGDTFDGPRKPASDDFDYWTHFAACEPPTLPIHVAASPVVPAPQPIQALRDSARRRFKDIIGACDALYNLAVEHGASATAAAGFAHNLNGEADNLLGDVYTATNAIPATNERSAAIAECMEIVGEVREIGYRANSSETVVACDAITERLSAIEKEATT